MGYSLRKKNRLKKDISSSEHDKPYKKAEPYETVKQGRSHGKL